jgi:hypothetical protein
MLPASLEEDKSQRFATGLRVIAWVWIVGVIVAYAAQVDLASVLALELTSVMAFELLGAAALAVGPGSIGLALSFVIERVSYLTADLNFF